MADITIPAEALEAASQVIADMYDEDLEIVRGDMEPALEAAAPLILAAELERLACDLDEQAEAFETAKLGTPASGMATVLIELAIEMRERAGELRGGAAHD